jgi:DNA polymerase-3 subunit gamma/tau
MTRLPGRFNDRTCALLDIPDLPIHAFQHIGDRKIKPQGGGGGGGVVPIIATVVAVVATVYAGPAVGAAIANSMGAALGATGTAALGAAAIGGATSAVNAAIAGGNIDDVLKAGAIGAAAGAVGGGVSANVPAGAGAVGRGAISGAASGATGASLRGQDVGRGAVIGGVAGGVGAGLRQALTDTSIGDVEAQEGGFYGEEGVAGTGTGLSPELASAVASFGARQAAQLTAQNLAPSPTSRQSSGQAQAQTPAPGGDVTTTGQPAPGSAALAQALRAGSPVIGGGGDQTTGRPVWNIASLRVKDETGS